jgi:hypothetical protein
MKKIFLCFFLSLIFFSGAKAQSLCDSIFISPKTVYLNQQNDSAAFVELSYTGHHDLSYAWIDFIFTDSSNIIIRQVDNTFGISGPFSYVPKEGYKIIYKNPSVPPNTIVNAQMRLYHSIGGVPFSCLKPVSFIVNSTTGIQGSQANFKFSLLPNPAKDFLFIEGGERGMEISVYDLSGRNVLKQKIFGSNSNIDIRKFSAGIYFVLIRSQASVFTKKFVKIR